MNPIGQPRGSAFRDRREQAGLTRLELAECILNNAGPNSPFTRRFHGAPGAQELADVIEMFEDTGIWNLSPEFLYPIPHFINACAQCFVGGNASLTDRAVTAIAALLGNEIHPDDDADDDDGDPGNDPWEEDK